MVLLSYICVFALSITLVRGKWDIEIPTEPQKNEDRCESLTKEPNFQSRMVTGKKWTVYYTWNMKLDPWCMDITFHFLDKTKVRRMMLEMRDYLKEKRQWPDTGLLMKFGEAGAMILFSIGASGRFVGVPYYQEQREKEPDEDFVSFYKIALKVLNRGHFLIISHCNRGVTSLAIRRDKRPDRKEINEYAANFDFGDPHPACTQEPDPL